MSVTASGFYGMHKLCDIQTVSAVLRRLGMHLCVLIGVIAGEWKSTVEAHCRIPLLYDMTLITAIAAQAHD